MSTLTVRLPDDLKAQLEKLSAQKHIAVSDLVRDSIRRYIAVERFAALRAKVQPRAAKRGFVTDDDVFGAVS